MWTGSFLATVRKAGVALLLAHGLAAQAAEVRVIAGPALSEVMTELGAQFERATGHKLAITYELAGGVLRRFGAGEEFDVAIGAPSTIDDLNRQGRVAGATRAEIARVGMGVGARRGAPRPDIGSVDAFKRAVLDAGSIAYAPEGATGKHLASVFQRLDMAEQVKFKTRPQEKPEQVAQAVADGEADLGFALTNILLSVRGVELVGLFPAELQNYVVFTMAVTSNARQPDAAMALVKFLTAPAAIPVFKAKGMEPGTR